MTVLPPNCFFVDTLARFAVVFGCVLYFLTFVATVVLFVFRSVPFVKIVGVNFVTLQVASNAIVWFSILTEIRIIPQTGVFLVCDLWNVWVYCLSIASMVAFIIFRLWRLDLILVQRREGKGWRLYLPVFLIWCPCIIYSIAGSVTYGDGPYYFEQKGWVMCYMANALLYTLVRLSTFPATC